MGRPNPLTATDELLVELVDEVVGLRDLLRDRLPEPPAPQDRTGTVELREPAVPPTLAAAPAAEHPPTQPAPPPVAPPPATRGAARQPAPRRKAATPPPSQKGRTTP